MIVCLWIWFIAGAIFTHAHGTIDDQDLIIEMLVVNVRAGDMERYLTIDNQIWTSFLRQQDGFISKHNLLSTHTTANNATEVYHIIEWQSYNQWKKIPSDQLTKITAQFIQAMGYAPDMKSLPNDDGFHLVQP